MLETKIWKILKHKEEAWRQKSREVWLEAGDNDTNVFHHFANKKRLLNVIWDNKGGHEDIFIYNKSLKFVIIPHF